MSYIVLKSFSKVKKVIKYWPLEQDKNLNKLFHIGFIIKMFITLKKIDR